MPTDDVAAGLPRPADAPRRPLPLAATGITVDTAERRVLDDVSLTLEPGSFTALTGASGAGKSTLLWVLAGALRPRSGTVAYAGSLVTDHDAATGAGVQLVPQSIALVTPLTARENLVVPLLVQGVPPREAHERAEEVLERVRLSDSGDHLVEELSGGQQQRVAVARGLALRASVLLADEPTSELDAATRDVVIALLAAEAAAGAAVLVATHDPACADQADAEYHLDVGRLRRVR